MEHNAPRRRTHGALSASTVDIYVEAPVDAREGDVNVLEIRVSDAVGKGAEVFEVPVRRYRIIQL